MRQTERAGKRYKTEYIDTGEFLFIIAYVVYLVRAIIEKSTFEAIVPVGGTVAWAARMFLLVMVCIKIIFVDEFSVSGFIKAGLLAALFALSMYGNRYMFLLDIFLLIVGAYGVELKRLVKVYFVIASVMCGTFFVLSLLGVIENYGFIGNGRGIRYAFGINYATDFAALVFYIQMSEAYIRERKYTLLTVLLWVGVAIFIIIGCDARLDSILIISFAVMMYIVSNHKSIMDHKGINRLMRWAWPILAVVSIWAHAAYDAVSSPEWMQGLNELLSKRFYEGKKIINDVGFKFFGSYIQMQGNAWTPEGRDEELGYYFLDCGYLNVVLRYGFLVLALLVIGYMVAMKRAEQRRDYVLILALFFIAVTSVIDHHIMQMSYNSFIFALSGLVGDANRLKTRVVMNVRKKEICQN